MRPLISTQRIVTALFLMLSARLGSLNALEQALGSKGAVGKRWLDWMGGNLPSADRLGEVAALVEHDELRQMLLFHHARRKRKKTLPALPGGLRVLVLDGHEMWTSYRQWCEGCCRREVSRHGASHTQYYLRYVAAYLMDAQGGLLMDLEMQQPGEGEIAAAQRLVQRLLERCPRAFNVVAGDALYLDPALCRTICDHRKDFIAVLKNEQRELIQDFRGVAAYENEAPLRFQYNGKTCTCQDIEGFTSWRQWGRPIRVVSSFETWTVRRQHTGEVEAQNTEWLWATSLSKTQASTQTIVRLGHGRWRIENQGFNELVHKWHADHVYHLDTRAIVTILLLLFLAYNLFYVWVARGLKPPLRDQHAPGYFAQQLQAEFHAALLRPG